MTLYVRFVLFFIFCHFTVSACESETLSFIHGDPSSEAGTDTQMDTDNDTDFDANANADAGTDSDTDADTDADNDSEGDTDTDPDIDTGSDTDSDVDIDAGTDTDTDTESSVPEPLCDENIPNCLDWMYSPHANVTAQAFTHWDEEDPPEIPVDCARCHSTVGFRDYLGDDGSDAGVVDVPVPVGPANREIVHCNACHNQTTETLSSVTFPSGVTLTNMGPEVRCMTCHQGRESTMSVNAGLIFTDGGAMDDDVVEPTLSLSDVHNAAAGATLFGGAVHGGYEYKGNYYQKFFEHADDASTCTKCHNSHTSRPRTAICVTCHTDPIEGETFSLCPQCHPPSEYFDFLNVRMAKSFSDYDGDGNTEEGIVEEMSGLGDALHAEIQRYAANGNGTDGICYNAEKFPHFFSDGFGTPFVCDESDFVPANRYATWTPRLLKAAYNYQFYRKDPGAYVHNAKYVINLLYDGISDLGGDVTGYTRDDGAHFNPTSRAWRYWDDVGGPEAVCARCHSPDGFEFYAAYGIDPIAPQPSSTGLRCESCHASFWQGAPRISIASVTFPGDVEVEGDAGAPDDSFICMCCHQGLQSKITIDEYLAATDSEELSFQNVHYLPAGSVKYGSEVHLGYEYEGKTYADKWSHAAGDRCTFCHTVEAQKHSFLPELNPAKECTEKCHLEVVEGDIETVRKNRLIDYDGDGDTAEKLEDELGAIAQALLNQIEQYGLDEGGSIPCYNESIFPYWFRDDLGADGVCDEADYVKANLFDQWTPALIKAAHNYQIFKKEPGSWAHNTDYMAQLLIDSVEDLGGDVKSFNRPESLR